MSKDFEKKIEKLFLNESSIINKEEFNNILLEYFNKIQKQKKLNEQGQLPNVTANDILKFLPKMEFTEEVGEPTSADRQQFESIIGGTLKSKPSIEEKIKYLSDFTKNIRGRSTQNILSSLMILKTLQNIISKASPGSAGLQTEAFIAGLLFGGAQIKRQASQNVVDIQTSTENYQLKVLAKNAEIKMSSQNMSKYFEQKDNLKFIIIYKNSPTELEFKTFTLTNEMISKNKKFANMLQKQNQFVITPETDGSYLHIKDIGVISVDNSVFDNYNNKLQQNVKNVLVQTANLINNINAFYIQNSPAAAGAGAQNAGTISNLLTEQSNK